MLSPGDRVRDCEVIAPLGRGGMAAVYLARRRGVGGFSRLVTLKLVHPHLVEDERIVELFLNEAHVSAQIAHPNVVHVEEVGEFEGGYFIAMEYVHGVTLAHLLACLAERRLRMRRKLCVWLAAQVAEALHAAHEARSENGTPLTIVHRDVSPKNVLIAHTGHVKLIDFGIAKVQSEGDQRSRAQPVLGTLRYMSPEQLRLERADRRADVYALGVMLWEMLTGRTLLRCQRFDDERDWAIRERPAAPSLYAAHSPPALDEVVLKAIAFRLGERYRNAFEFRTALLRAEPDVVQIDAPMVAALMHSLLGDELDERSARWPREIVAEFDATPGVSISNKWSLDDLTEVTTVAGERYERPEDLAQVLTPSAPPFIDDSEDEATMLLSPLTHPRALAVPAAPMAAVVVPRLAQSASVRAATLALGAVLLGVGSFGGVRLARMFPAVEEAVSAHMRSPTTGTQVPDQDATQVGSVPPRAADARPHAHGAAGVQKAVLPPIAHVIRTRTIADAERGGPAQARSLPVVVVAGRDPGEIPHGTPAAASPPSVVPQASTAGSSLPRHERVWRKRAQRRAMRRRAAQVANAHATREAFVVSPAANPYTSAIGDAADSGRWSRRAAQSPYASPTRTIPASGGVPSDDTTITYWRSWRGLSHP